MREIKGGELLLQCLQAEGVTTLFGILDGSFNAFLAKLNDYGMRFINARHEAAAVHMAEAWARVRGEPAVVLGGIGPGAANMVSGVVTAYAEGVPLIAISGQRRRNIIYPDRGGSFQNVDLLGLYKPVTKWSAGVREWNRIPELVRRAFREALNGRPGPVYLEIPEDIMRADSDAEQVQIFLPAQYRAGKASVGNPAALEQAAEMLVNAQRPLLHAGSGVSWAGAWNEFIALADYIAAPMTTSLAARGVVPEDHPRYFHPLNRDAYEAARSQADVVLAVGGRLGELDGWGRGETWGPVGEQKLIQIDLDPLSIGVNRPVDIGIVADARAALALLLQKVQSATPPRQERAEFESYREMSQNWQALLSSQMESEDGINPGALVKSVREFFPRDAVTVMDGGNTSLWVASYNPILAPRSYLYATKFGHLGTGLPYALGAKLAAPDRSVYLISGDGAIGFNLQELETARRYNLNIVIIVSCDKGWGMERSSQTFFDIDEWVECDLYPEARYDLVAQALGCYGEKVDTLAGVRPALERAVASKKPALLQVMVDQNANMMPPGLLTFSGMVYKAEN